MSQIQTILQQIENVIGRCEIPTNHAELINIFEKLYGLIEQLKQLQKKPRLPTATINEFKDWSRNHNIVFDGIDVRSCGEYGNGLFAAKEFKRGDVLVKVPQSTMLDGSLKTWNHLQEVLSADPIYSSNPTFRLTMRVLMEAIYAESSTWRPYLGILPKQFNIPLYMNPDDLKRLSGVSVLYEAIQAFIMTIRYYMHIFRIISNHAGLELKQQEFTFSMFQWASAIVWTRQNGTQENASSVVLIPVFDMFNHEQGEMTTGFDVEQSSSVTCAKRGFSVDEQLFISYGRRSNQHLFVFSGFVDTKTKLHDMIRIPSAVNKNDDLCRERMTLLHKHDMSELKFVGLHHPSGGPIITFPELIYLRVLVASKAGVCQLQQDSSILLKKESELDTAVWTWIKMKCLVSKRQIERQGPPVNTANSLVDQIRQLEIEHFSWIIQELESRGETQDR